jgi:hypothetical protein
VAVDSAFAATGRFGEVFSKLRAETVALGGGADGAPGPAPFCGAGRLFLGTRWAINQFETQIVLDTLPEAPEIHLLGRFYLGIARMV